MPQRKNSELLTKTATDENLADFLSDLGGWDPRARVRRCSGPRARTPLLWPARARAAALPCENRGKTQIQNDATAIQASG